MQSWIFVFFIFFFLLCGLHKVCCIIYVASRQNGKRKSKTAAPARFSLFGFSSFFSELDLEFGVRRSEFWEWRPFGPTLGLPGVAEAKRIVL